MGDSIHFKLSSELSFKSVDQESAKLFKILAENKDAEHFCLDLSEVCYCDSAGLALLIEARKLCQHHHKVFRVLGSSSETQSLAEFCGVKEVLF